MRDVRVARRDHDERGVLDRLEHAGRRPRERGALEAQAVHLVLVTAADEPLLERERPGRRLDDRAQAIVGRRQQAQSRGRTRRRPGRSPSRAARPARSALRAHEVEADVAVAELEPGLVVAELLRRLERVPGLAAPAPAALLVVHVGERVEQAVEVRRDVQAEHLGVVADVADHGHLARRPTRSTRPRTKRAPPTPPERTHTSAICAVTLSAWPSRSTWRTGRSPSGSSRFATLLELADANPYTARAYRRAAELIRATTAPVAELVRAGRVRELRGIGRGIEARLRELVETGEIAELEELEREVAPDLVGLGRYLGIGARQAVLIARTLGVRTADELREAAAAGRLREVPGIGPQTEAKLLAALARDDEPRPPRGLLLHRARRLLDEIADAARRHAGRRPAPVSRLERAASRSSCAASDPTPVLDAFAALPQIVAVLERVRAARVRRDGRGRAGRARRRAAGARSGPSSCARPARREYVAALEPLPDAPDEDGVYRALGIPSCPPELREAPFRGEPPPLVELARHPRRPALPHDLVGRDGERRGDGAAPRSSAATSTSRSATTRRPSAPSAA